MTVDIHNGAELAEVPISKQTRHTFFSLFHDWKSLLFGQSSYLYTVFQLTQSDKWEVWERPRDDDSSRALALDSCLAN